MKITVSFDSLEEFQQYMNSAQPIQQPQEAPKAAEPKKNTKKQEKPAQEPTEVPWDAMPEPQGEAVPQEVTEDYRVEVRKTLAQLNKKIGRNIASDLIKGFGVSKLTEVALSDLPALMEKAKEALNAE